MPAKLTIPIGTRFGRLTVTHGAPERRNGRWCVPCLCDCGATTTVQTKALRNGNTRSCGCLYRDTRPDNTTHGLSRTAPVEYRTWMAMRARCSNPRTQNYPWYGGRGITVCPEWDDFAVFYRDMGPKPSPRHTIDRVDNDQGYSAENCRWIPWSQQRRNQRRSVMKAPADTPGPL